MLTARFLSSIKKVIPRRPSISINENDLIESFMKGGGAGGQKVNKTNSKVQLRHIPTGIIVETQRFRELAANRLEARKLLSFKLDDLYNGNQSIRALKIAKSQLQKRKKKQRARAKYGNTDNDNDS